MEPKYREAFHIWLDKFWPLWKQHVGGVRYQDLKSAFYAGVIVQIVEGQVEQVLSTTRKYFGTTQRRR